MQSLDLSRATVGSELSLLTLSCLSPNKQSSAPIACQVLFETIGTHAPLEHARPIKRQGESNKTAQLSPETKRSTSGASAEDGYTLNGSLYAPNRRPSSTLPPTCLPSSLITVPSFMYSVHLLPLLAAETWLYYLVIKKRLFLYKLLEWLRYPHPPFLPSVSLRQALHVQPSKHSTCHGSLTGC